MMKIGTIIPILLFLATGTSSVVFSGEKAQGEKAEPGEERSGGTTTVFQTGRTAFSLPLANITRENKRAHAVGNSFFNKNWVIAPASTEARDGLGPLFHAKSCSGCHTLDGRGAPPKSKNELMVGLLFRLSIPGKNEQCGPLPDPNFGGQLGVRAIPGFEPEGNVAIDFEDVPGTFGDGSTYILKRPVYTLSTAKIYGKPHPDLMMSPRVAPPVFGLGLLEAVEESEILALADPSDSDKDGISGRPNYVWDQEKKKAALGRFGWKANQPTIRQQTAGAFLGDIGITSDLNPNEDLTETQTRVSPPVISGGSPELEERLLNRIVVYQQTLAPPARRNWDDAKVLRGKRLFHEAKCAVCHVPVLKTADSVPGLEELEKQTIRPFTDLLLHDMGEELADNRPDFEATGREWRTPPLWGIGLTEAVNGHNRFLHDGRARGLEEAILWHGGEAFESRDNFRKMPKQDRDCLIAFLKSL